MFSRWSPSTVSNAGSRCQVGGGHAWAGAGEVCVLPHAVNSDTEEHGCQRHLAWRVVPMCRCVVGQCLYRCSAIAVCLGSNQSQLLVSASWRGAGGALRRCSFYRADCEQPGALRPTALRSDVHTNLLKRLQDCIMSFTQTGAKSKAMAQDPAEIGDNCQRHPAWALPSFLGFSS